MGRGKGSEGIGRDRKSERIWKDSEGIRRDGQR
jgi:hypothetical protein